MWAMTPRRDAVARAATLVGSLRRSWSTGRSATSRSKVSAAGRGSHLVQPDLEFGDIEITLGHGLAEGVR